jgi:hypothetical protein
MGLCHEDFFNWGGLKTQMPPVDWRELIHTAQKQWYDGVIGHLGALKVQETRDALNKIRAADVTPSQLMPRLGMTLAEFMLGYAVLRK